MPFHNKLKKAFKALRRPETRHALRQGVVATYEHAALLRSLGPLQTILDVGANVGQFTLLCRIIQPQADIHAFEPMSKAGNKIERLFGPEPKVTLHRCALGATSGTAEIHLATRADSSSLMAQAAQAKYFPGTREIGVETIRVARLSEELSSHEIKGPVLLKIDVQGFEGEVLKGCEDMLSHINWIYCEASFVELYQGQPLAHEIIIWLAERGFSLAGVEVGPGMAFEGRAVQADFLFSKMKTAA
jgi:FkbM family methyltransferase